MANHFSVDDSMPSAKRTNSPLTSDEILAHFEAEQTRNRPQTPSFLTVSLIVFCGMIALVGLTSLRPGTASSGLAASAPSPVASSFRYINWNYSFEAAQQQAATSGKPMMVEFYTDWCGVCKQMDAGTYSDPAVIAETQNVVAVKINAESRTDLAQRYGINSYPTFVWMDGTGAERTRVSAGFNAPDFVNLMQRNR